jgi:hypothetical protein
VQNCFLNCFLPKEVASTTDFYIDEIEMEVLRGSWPSEFSHSLGQSRPNWAFRAMSGLPPVVTELRAWLVVRLVPQADSCIAANGIPISITSSSRLRSMQLDILPMLFTDFSPAQELVAACLRLLLRPEILI